MTPQVEALARIECEEVYCEDPRMSILEDEILDTLDRTAIAVDMILGANR